MWCVAAEMVCDPRRVVDHEVRVGADGNDPLAAGQPEHPCRRRRADLHPALLADAARDDAAVVHQVHPVLDARQPVGDLAEVALAQLLLVVEVERAVVGRDDLEVVLDDRPSRARPGAPRGAAAASRRTWRPRSRCPCPRATGTGTAGRSRRMPGRPGRAPPAGPAARHATTCGRCTRARPRPRPVG